MVAPIFSYIQRQSPLHRISGAAKLIFFLLWSTAAMVTFDTRLLLAMSLVSIALFAISKIKWRDVSVMITFILFFLIFNMVAIFLFSPLQGVEIYGTKTVLFELTPRYIVTGEQLLYQLNVILRYVVMVPTALLFIATTHPSEFAASLNKIGISYKISYSVALALRYIPEIQRNFQHISKSQQARGVEMSKKAPIFKRVKNAVLIVTPLIFSSLENIEIITNAMELRGFGRHQKRTWYWGKPFGKQDWIAMVFGVSILLVAILLGVVSGTRFWNPFAT